MTRERSRLTKTSALWPAAIPLWRLHLRAQLTALPFSRRFGRLTSPLRPEIRAKNAQSNRLARQA
jgi:hypothetical protein